MIFLEGDPGRPIITGRVYNAEQMPPYALPDNQTQSGIKRASSQRGDASNFNELRFEDKKGPEEFYAHAEKDLTTEVEHDEKRTIQNDRTTTVQHDDTLTVQTRRIFTIANFHRSMAAKEFCRPLVRRFSSASGTTMQIDAGMELSVCWSRQYS